MSFDIELGHIVSILGQRNSGKSNLLDFLMSNMEQFVNIDIIGEHMVDGAISVESVEQFVTALNEGYSKIHIHDPNAYDEEKLEEYLGIFGQLENYFLIIDEIQNWTNENYCPSVLEQIVQVHSSHKNCGVIIATRQATPIPRSIWNESNHYIIYHYGKSRDAKIKGLPIADEDKNKIHTIDPNSYRFLYISDETGIEPQILERVPLMD
jgi:ABC-type dipeptide/oligopeptide/nickel transport system ATPase subunit